MDCSSTRSTPWRFIAYPRISPNLCQELKKTLGREDNWRINLVSALIRTNARITQKTAELVDKNTGFRWKQKQTLQITGTLTKEIVFLPKKKRS